MTFIKGPDFPTSGIICGTEGITKAYLTEGSIVTRAKVGFKNRPKKEKKLLLLTNFHIKLIKLI